jgi:hypothetical protein
MPKRPGIDPPSADTALKGFIVCTFTGIAVELPVKRSEATAVFLVASELARRDYIVNMMPAGYHVFDIEATDAESGRKCSINVRGQEQKAAWRGKRKRDFAGLFYILVHVGKTRDDDEFFILSQQEYNECVQRRYHEWREKPDRDESKWQDGFPYNYVTDYKNRWDKLTNFVKDQQTRVKESAEGRA